MAVCRVLGECRTPVVSQTACLCLGPVASVSVLGRVRGASLPVGGLGSPPGLPSVCNPVAETDA